MNNIPDFSILLLLIPVGYTFYKLVGVWINYTGISEINKLNKIQINLLKENKTYYMHKYISESESNKMLLEEIVEMEKILISKGTYYTFSKDSVYKMILLHKSKIWSDKSE